MEQTTYARTRAPTQYPTHTKSRMILGLGEAHGTKS